jgi:hypothetical protein
MIPSMIALLIPLTTLLMAPEVTTDVGEVATLRVRWEKGVVTVLKVERTLLARPAHYQRFRGRFEARVLGAGNGDKVLDFVRFDFPLMAMADSVEEMGEQAAELGAQMRSHVTATTVVKVPLPAGAASLAIYDTGTHKTVLVPLTPWSPASGRPPAPVQVQAPPPAPPPPAPAAAPTRGSAGAAGRTRR